MSTLSPKRPGAGFVVLLMTLAGACAFFAWGLATPPLDRVWRMQLELNLGQGGPLSESDFRLLQETLRRYPELADNMLEESSAGLISANAGGVVDDGFAYLVRKRPDAPSRLIVGGIVDERVGVTARTLLASTAGMVEADAPLTWSLPGDGPFPQLVEVRVTGEGKSSGKRREKVPEPAGSTTIPKQPPLSIGLIP